MNAKVIQLRIPPIPAVTSAFEEYLWKLRLLPDRERGQVINMRAWQEARAIRQMLKEPEGVTC